MNGYPEGMFWDVGRRQLAEALALLLLAGGCAQQAATHVKADLSGPKPAALTFLKAIAARDAATARRASIGSDQDKQWIDAMISLIGGLQRYDRALVRVFGSQAIPAVVDLRQAVQTLTLDPINYIDGGTVRQQGEDTAEIIPGFGKVTFAAEPPMYLRKIKGVWKVDLTAMARDPGHDAAHIRQMRQAGDALQDAARQVLLGRYRTLEQAEQAVDQPLPGSAGG